MRFFRIVLAGSKIGEVPEEIIMAVLAGKTRYEQKREIIRKILFKLRTLLQHNSEELNRKITQLEIIGDLRNVQQIIVEEENKMALTYNIERDIRYRQGLEKGLESGMQKGLESGMQKGLEAGLQKGLESGIQKATVERNTAFVTYLLQNTDQTVEQIAAVVNVPAAFVQEVRDKLM